MNLKDAKQVRVNDRLVDKSNGIISKVVKITPSEDFGGTLYFDLIPENAEVAARITSYQASHRIMKRVL